MNLSQKSRHFLVYALLSIIFSVSHTHTQDWITIFVHGTIGLRSHITPGLLFNLLCDCVEHTSYAQNAKKLRSHPRLFGEQAMQELGLHPIIRSDNTAYSGPYALSLSYDGISHIFTPHQENTYYTYGWSGILSAKRRFYEAFDFYDALKKHIHELKSQHKNPKIRIVGYSHGGNVALNMAGIQHVYYPDDSFTIDELILMGVPIQHENECCIHFPLFKRIYNIYSLADPIQRMDIFTPGGFFSHKKFKGTGLNPLPEKLTQIGIRVTAHKYVSYKAINTLTAPLSLPCSPFFERVNTPGHFDLWLFGWNRKDYNQKSLFYPLPSAAFIPYIVSTVSGYEGTYNILNMYPESEKSRIAIKKYDKKCRLHTLCRKTIPFLPLDQFQHLKRLSASFDPQVLCSAPQDYDVYWDRISHDVKDETIEQYYTL
jgi:hypothetical protein